ncbi:MAG: hypothetical protein LBN00_06900, partial [Oscillospiraceae bacterium]|nr:hypothetical protein [Oscillospiraceae bacterium]
WRGIARDYPNNYTAQSFFAQRLIGLGETMEELDKNGKEAISVCERVLERCTDSKIRHDVEAILPNAYSLTGDTKKAIECAFALPRAQQGMENALAFIVNFDKNFKQYEHLTHSETRDILHANAIMAVFLCQTQILTLFGRVGTVDNQPAVNYLEDEPDAGLVNAFEDISSVLERHFQYLYDKIK